MRSMVSISALRGLIKDLLRRRQHSALANRLFLLGPIVRVAPDTLSFSSATALGSIYGSRSSNVQKSEFYKTFDYAGGAWSSATEIDKDKHAAKRRWLNPIFSAEAIKISEPIINETIQKFCDTIDPNTQGWGEKWNATNMTNYLATDIMGAWLLGVDFRAVAQKRTDAIHSSR